MNQPTHNPDRSKSGSSHGQRRPGEHTNKAPGDSLHSGQLAREEPNSQRCALDHVHDANCDFGRKAAPKSQRDDRPERGSIKDPYSVGQSHKLPSTSKDSDSDGWHRTTDRTA